MSVQRSVHVPAWPPLCYGAGRDNMEVGENRHELYRGLTLIASKPRCNLGGSRSVDQVGLFSTNPHQLVKCQVARIYIDEDMHLYRVPVSIVLD